MNIVFSVLRSHRRFLSMAFACGLLGASAPALAANANANARIAALRARVHEKRDREAREAAAMPSAMGVDQVFAAAARHHAMFGAPDAGFQVAALGNEHIELGTEHFVVRGKDGAARAATIDDLHAAGVGTKESLRATFAEKLERSLAKGPGSLAALSDEALSKAVDRAIAAGGAQAKSLLRHPDVQRLVAMRRAFASNRVFREEPIELLDANHDASLRLDGKGRLVFRFGSVERPPTVGDLTWLGLSDAARASDVFGRRLFERMTGQARTVKQARLQIDQVISEARDVAAVRRVAAAKRAKQRAQLASFLERPDMNANASLLSMLAGETGGDMTFHEVDGVQLQIEASKDGKNFFLNYQAPYSARRADVDYLRQAFGITNRAQLDALIKQALLKFDPAKI